MKPRGPLMIEHRLIERMLVVIAHEARRIEAGGHVDAVFIDQAVDFVRIYADRTHHGKEEDILFRKLKDKPLVPADTAAMEELIAEHRQAREKVRALVEAKGRFEKGDTAAVKEITSIMEWLADFYPRHIAKEDKDFFPRTEGYFSKDELAEMLLAFRDFDGKMIHEKYGKLVDLLDARGE